MKHLILIRFNSGNQDPSWLEHRLKFFRAFTLPSLLNQTNQDFTVVFGVDPTSTPSVLKRELEEYGLVFETVHGQSDRGWKEMHTFVFRQFLSDYLGDEQCILTTRLDSDDGLSLDYIEHTQRVAFRGPAFYDRSNEFFVYNEGIVWSEGKFFLKRDVSGPFLSLIEWRTRTPALPGTVFCLRTHLEALEADHQAFDGKPMWLMACHDRNLLNKVGEIGRELSLEEVQEHFEVDVSWLT